ncbi:Uncharacterised protein [Candidatus Tiddalikarchaeum anstoanum]|nr:Uncharacterised protein [Candidatus Tiddalikarchaeum anstoanum]
MAMVNNLSTNSYTSLDKECKNFIEMLLCSNLQFDLERYNLAVNTGNRDLAPELVECTKKELRNLFTTFVKYFRGVARNSYPNESAYLEAKKKYDHDVGAHLASKFRDYSGLNAIFTDPNLCTMLASKLSNDLELYAKYVENLDEKQLEHHNLIGDLEKRLETENVKKNIWQLVVKNMLSFFEKSSPDVIMDFIGSSQNMYEHIEKFVNDPKKFTALKSFCDSSFETLQTDFLPKTEDEIFNETLNDSPLTEDERRIAMDPLIAVVKSFNKNKKIEC